MKEQWELILKTNRYPCIIANADTFEIICTNDEFLKLTKSNQKVIGQPFFDVIENDNLIDFQEMKEIWTTKNILNLQLNNSSMNYHFQVTLTYIKEQNVLFLLHLPTEETKLMLSNFEEAMSRCMDIFNQPPETILTSYSQLLCKYYDCEAAYVYRFGEEDATISCIGQWSIAPDIMAVAEVSDVMETQPIIQWLQDKNTPSLIIGDKNNKTITLSPVLTQMLSVFQLENLTLYKVEDGNEKIVGVVGLSNPKNIKFFDRRLISTIAHFVAQNVTKEFVDATLFQLHHRDTLTGLFNRVGYARRMETLKESPPEKIGIISVNVNGLKTINQNYGNEQGDLHIKKIAQTVKQHFNYDTYRISGGEFVSLAPDIDKDTFEKSILLLQEKMRKEQNYDFSIGSSWGSGHYNLSSLLAESDTKMYINKQEYYSSGGHHFDGLTNAILKDLLTYLENDEFMIYLQPQVKLKDGSLHGAEALIRRYDKTNQKMVFPDEFISLYEQNSVIRHVDLFVVETVCKLLAQWCAIEKGLPISVNLSRVTLQEFGIVDTIVSICDKHQIPHNLLVIEVTERVGLIENNVASSLITDFINNGFTISLDDFGCAYSNIITLAQIDVGEVKLDKSLVDDLTKNRKNHVLVKNVLSMCDELEGMSTLAEGIEDENQSNLLYELGCYLGQGYFYSKPIPVSEFAEKYIL